MDKTARTILLMDDEDLIRDMSTLMLERLLYSVTTCTRGEEAIELYRRAMESGAPFWAAIFDVDIAGGMGGVQAAQEILRFDATAKLILCSSYTREPAMTSPTQYGFRASLGKPFSLAALAEVLEGL